jgi:hypothetical protein
MSPNKRQRVRHLADEETKNKSPNQVASSKGARTAKALEAPICSKSREIAARRKKGDDRSGRCGVNRMLLS